MSGESPTRPGILNARPLVVVMPEKSPLASSARQLIVPHALSGSIPSNRHICSRESDDDFFGGAAYAGTSSFLGGPQSSMSLICSFQRSHFSRDASVSRFSSLKPCATANRRAPSPTIRMREVRSITSRATRDGYLMSLIAATAPAPYDGPSMIEQSSSTSPSALGSPP